MVIKVDKEGLAAIESLLDSSLRLSGIKSLQLVDGVRKGLSEWEDPQENAKEQPLQEEE